MFHSKKFGFTSYSNVSPVSRKIMKKKNSLLLKAYVGFRKVGPLKLQQHL